MDNGRHIVVRPLGEGDDLMAVSRVYEEAWRAAYSGIVPQGYLDSIETGRWASRIGSDGCSTLVACEGETIVGSCGYGPARPSDAAAGARSGAYTCVLHGGA